MRQWSELPAEYVVLIFHYAQMPADKVIRNLELFMKHVKPALDELTPYTARTYESAVPVDNVLQHRSGMS